MGSQIIGLHDWLATPVGAYLLAWEREQLAAAVTNVFGFHALQLGLPALDGLAANRMPHRWVATEAPNDRATFVTDFANLPFPANSLDLVVLPHSLEFTANPHAALREVERVLVPEGRVVICGLNPMSLWGLRQSRARLYRRFGIERHFLPDAGEFIGYLRMRDWLRLLGLEIESGHFGCYRPAMSSASLLARFAWMDRLGERWWPILGAVYCLVAVKRVRGMTLLNPARKLARPFVVAPVSVAGHAGSTSTTAQKHLKTEE